MGFLDAGLLLSAPPRAAYIAKEGVALMPVTVSVTGAKSDVGENRISASRVKKHIEQNSS